MKLSVKTGNATSRARDIRSFEIEVDRPPTVVQFALDGGVGQVDANEWFPLLDQIRAKELVKRHSPGQMDPPLGDLSRVTAQISSTPTFQLFLAGTDIAERIGLVSESSYNWVSQRFAALNHWMPSVTGAGGLFFVPDNIFAQATDAAILELLRNNKLCTAILCEDTPGINEVQRYYMPYATPIGFVAGPVSREAERLWDAVRTLYYAFRQPA
jgi:hypothetical protein